MGSSGCELVMIMRPLYVVGGKWSVHYILWFVRLDGEVIICILCLIEIVCRVLQQSCKCEELCSQ